MRRLVRDDVARELIFSGRIFNGQEALGLGQATRVCNDPRSEALAFAKEVATKSPDVDQRGQAAPRPGCRGRSACDTAGRDHRTGEADWIAQSGRGGAGGSGEAGAPAPTDAVPSHGSRCAPEEAAMAMVQMSAIPRFHAARKGADAAVLTHDGCTVSWGEAPPL